MVGRPADQQLGRLYSLTPTTAAAPFTVGRLLSLQRHHRLERKANQLIVQQIFRPERSTLDQNHGSGSKFNIFESTTLLLTRLRTSQNDIY